MDGQAARATLRPLRAEGPDEAVPRADDLPALWTSARLGGEQLTLKREMPNQTIETLHALLDSHFTLARTLDLPFLIREHAHKFQWSVAQATGRIRR